MNLRHLVFLTLAVIALESLPHHEMSAQPAFAGAKRELRGVWIASVDTMDWPRSTTLTPQQQRDSLTVLLDLFAASGFNAIFFQVRPECDALYISAIEPWSFWLTGAQGTAPNPLYDPLAFAVTEAHKRGMELHAWFNPYRAYRNVDSYPRHSSHIIQQHPEWTIRCPDGYYLLNPGLPEVRNYVAKIVADVTRRYGVDGIHMDDYFYPYPEHSFTKQDSSTWAAYPRGFSWDSVAYWRRDNVNIMVHQLYDTVQVIKPWIKFGVSPFGIWKANVPVGISGTSTYNDLFYDPVAWFQGKYIDYLVPQLYWAFGGGQDYASLQAWWASQRNGRHLYTGNADYKIAQSGWDASEITKQIRFNQTNSNVQGSVQFRAYNLRTNDAGIVDALTTDVFRFPSLVPVMSWKETTSPNAPSALQVQLNSSTGKYELQWQPPAAASDGDTALRYVVYRFTKPTPVSADMENPRNIIAVIGAPPCAPPTRIDSFDVQYYYAISALDKNNNESGISNIVTTSARVASPGLVSPAAGSLTYKKGDRLIWQSRPTASLYRVQLDSTGTFVDGQMPLNRATKDTFAVPTGLLASKTYFWRVVAGNQTSESAASAIRSFTTGWLVPPTLLFPLNKVGIPRLTTFQWASNRATSYRLRVIDNTTHLTVLDTTAADTSITCNTALTASRIFVWNVLAINAYGESDWSAEGRFQTGTSLTAVTEDPELPLRFALEQNYPNPFNPNSEIRYQIAELGSVSLVVYDLLGRKVATLVDGMKAPGNYVATFDATGLASGVYLYRLQAGSFTATKKMVVLR